MLNCVTLEIGLALNIAGITLSPIPRPVIRLMAVTNSCRAASPCRSLTLSTLSLLNHTATNPTTAQQGNSRLETFCAEHKSLEV